MVRGQEVKRWRGEESEEKEVKRWRGGEVERSRGEEVKRVKR